MRENSPPWQSDIDLLLLHPTGPQLLLWQDGSGWSLPHLQLSLNIWAPEAGPVGPALWAQFGLAANILRVVAAEVDRTQHHRRIVYTAELCGDPAVLPSSARWVDRAQFRSLPGLSEPLRVHVETALAELDDEPLLRSPWARRGWLAPALSWIETQLVRLGCTREGPFNLVKSCGISRLLRVPTSRGSLYFKAIPGPLTVDGKTILPLLFSNEPALTTELAALYPTLVPTPLAIDPTRRWMLLSDFGSVLGASQVELDWERAVVEFAQLQRESAGHLTALASAGCLDRRLPVLAAQIEPLLDHPEIVAALSSEELVQFRALAPRLHALCAELASYRLPPTLVHGDLHGGNIALKDGRLLFFDWTDACIGHPFLDMVTLWEHLAHLGQSEILGLSSLRALYLQQWSAYGALDRLETALALGDYLGALHQVVSYTYIVASLEETDRPDLRGGLRLYLKRLLHPTPSSSSIPGTAV